MIANKPAVVNKAAVIMGEIEDPGLTYEDWKATQIFDSNGFNYEHWYATKNMTLVQLTCKCDSEGAQACPFKDIKYFDCQAMRRMMVRDASFLYAEHAEYVESLIYKGGNWPDIDQTVYDQMRSKVNEIERDTQVYCEMELTDLPLRADMHKLSLIQQKWPSLLEKLRPVVYSLRKREYETVNRPWFRKYYEEKREHFRKRMVQFPEWKATYERYVRELDQEEERREQSTAEFWDQWVEQDIETGYWDAEIRKGETEETRELKEEYDAYTAWLENEVAEFEANAKSKVLEEFYNTEKYQTFLVELVAARKAIQEWREQEGKLALKIPEKRVYPYEKDPRDLDSVFSQEELDFFAWIAGRTVEGYPLPLVYSIEGSTYTKTAFHEFNAWLYWSSVLDFEFGPDDIEPISPSKKNCTPVGGLLVYYRGGDTFGVCMVTSVKAQNGGLHVIDDVRCISRGRNNHLLSIDVTELNSSTVYPLNELSVQDYRMYTITQNRPFMHFLYRFKAEKLREFMDLAKAWVPKQSWLAKVKPVPAKFDRVSDKKPTKKRKLQR